MKTLIAIFVLSLAMAGVVYAKTCRTTCTTIGDTQFCRTSCL